jgi:hypothetical protein
MGIHGSGERQRDMPRPLSCMPRDALDSIGRTGSGICADLPRCGCSWLFPFGEFEDFPAAWAFRGVPDYAFDFQALAESESFLIAAREEDFFFSWLRRGHACILRNAYPVARIILRIAFFFFGGRIWP